MRGFDRLQDIVKNLRNHGMPGHDANSLISSISSYKLYLKSFFKGNLKEHSPVKSHCIGFSLSHPNIPFLRKDCFSGHSESCEFCDSVSDLFQAIRGSVQKYHSDKSSLEYRKVFIIG